MLSLTEQPVKFVKFHNKRWPINLAYDNVLRFLEMLDDTEFDDAEKIVGAFQIFFERTIWPDDYNDLIEIIQQISNYIFESPYGNGLTESDANVAPARFYSYRQDAPAIYASFMQQYSMDLVEAQGRLHWDKFKALLDGLDENTEFRKIVNIRQRSTDGLKGKELADLMELQQYYRLTDGASVDAQTKRTDAMLDALFAG